jgi:hypothetical protein
MSISYHYFGYDTLSSILVGNGRGAWRRWGLMDHEGPFFNLSYLGYPATRYVYLPIDLLELLYARFRQANPSGVALHSDYAQGEALALRRYTEGELDTLRDQRKVFVTIDLDDDEEGYPHMRSYLPELFEPSTIERLASDPWLDEGLLTHAEHLGLDKGGISPNLWVDRSARWSPEWRAYCDNLSKMKTK